jgi:hypothetical protein
MYFSHFGLLYEDKYGNPESMSNGNQSMVISICNFIKI